VILATLFLFGGGGLLAGALIGLVVGNLRSIRPGYSLRGTPGSLLPWVMGFSAGGLMLGFVLGFIFSRSGQ
jgi:hypothetical protein